MAYFISYTLHKKIKSGLIQTIVLISLATVVNADTPQINVIELSAHSQPRILFFDGTMHPYRTVDIACEIGGTVIQQQTHLGQWINKGELLIELDARRLILAMQLRKADLQAATKRRNIASKTLTRMEKMYDQTLVSEEDFDQASIAYFNSDSQYKTALALHKLAELDVTDAQIKAPYSGEITAIHVEVGQMVSPGQKLVRIAKTDTLLVSAEVNADDIQWLRQGLAAKVQAIEGLAIFSANLQAFVTVADPFTHRYKVELISTESPSIAYGSIARVALTTQDSLHGVVVNAEALRSFGGQSYAYIIEQNAEIFKLRKTAVSVAKELGNGLFLISKGLKPGVSIAAAGALMSDGLHVQIGDVVDITP